MRKVRTVIRVVAALVIWAHALAIIPARRFPIGNLASTLRLTESETIIVLVLALLSVLWSYGLTKFFLDLAYIYFFPFVVIYCLARVLLFVVRFLYARFGSSPLPALSKSDPEPAVASRPDSSMKVLEAAVRRPLWKGCVAEVSRPFRQFTLLWCLLLLLSSNIWLVRIALAIVLLHLVRILFRILLLTVFSIRWLSGLEDRLKTYAEGLIAKVLEISGKAETSASASADARKWLMSLIALKTAAAILGSKRFVAQSVMVLGFVAFAAIYAYLSLLFSFAYYGVAHAQSISLPWARALVISTFIPFMVTALPHNAWLLLLGGVHAAFVLSLGVGTVLGYLGRKLDSFRNAAEGLKSQLEREEVKEAMTRLSKELNFPFSPANVSPKSR